MPANPHAYIFECPFEILAPRKWTLPAVFNAPHSGRCYPPAFLAQSRLDALTLRKSEDCHVDELFTGAVDCGAPLFKANFPRAFLDVNREPFELDPRMFRDELPGYVNSASVRVTGGLGTIPRIVAEGEEIYRAPLRFADALDRIERYYRPYHRRLAALMNEAHKGYGAVLLVDCHSMPSSAAAATANGSGARADIVLGNRHGVSCSEAVLLALESAFRIHGFSTLRNRPYAGGFITQTYGEPNLGRHALQIEINRGCYMNERTFEKLPGFDALRSALRSVLTEFLAGLGQLIAPMQLAAE
jgi:N-formylglutamate amidohydrolase